MGESEFILPRTGGSHGDLDASHADTNQGTEFQQLEADGAAGGLGELRMRQPDATERAEQHISHGREPEAELMGTHGGSRGAVGEQIELALLDPVLHLATGAVDHLVEVLRGTSYDLSEVTTKRGLASPRVTSALPTTRRLRLQLSSVDHTKSLKRRADLPVRRLS